MTYRGIRHGAPDVIARLERGETVDPGDYYFRVAPVFETAATQYTWLNNVISPSELATAAPTGASTTAFSRFNDLPRGNPRPRLISCLKEG
jgi:Protein of unknown function (DUF3237)